MPSTTRPLSRLWVAAQFGLVALMLAWPAPAWRLHWPALAGLGGGVALALWTLLHNRPGNFNVVPEPRAGGHLVTSGPYRHIRHPMYLSLALCMAGVAAAAQAPVQWAAWLALCLVLNAKAAMEERLLCAAWPAYSGYMRRTRRFVPGLW